MKKAKLVRITTVPISLEKLLSGQLRFMSRWFDVIAVSSNGERLAKLGQQEGVRTFELAMTRKITPVQDLMSVARLYSFLRREKPEIVHTHTPKAGIVGMFAAWLAGVPHRLHTVAGLPLLEEKGIKRKILDTVEKLTYKFATRVYPNSHGLRDIIIHNRYCPPNKLKVLGNGSSNGIDTGHFSPEHFSADEIDILKSGLGIKPTDFVFIFVGRIVRDKGINELVLAFADAHRQFPHLKLLLVGDYEPDLDPLEASTMELISGHEAIISAGFKQDVRPYFAISDVLAFPSYREGFPNGVMQAGAMGLPSIVTNINGCNEIIIDGANGLIIPVKDTAALLGAMLRMLNNRESYEMMRAQSRKMIVDRYEQKVIWDALLDEYQFTENHV